MFNPPPFQNIIMENKKTAIIALGGNALSPKDEAGTIQQQFRHTRESLKAVLHFVKSNYNICITHGNWPQVGAELSKNEISMDIIPPLPLNVLVANHVRPVVLAPSVLIVIAAVSVLRVNHVSHAAVVPSVLNVIHVVIVLNARIALIVPTVRDVRDVRDVLIA